jgi:zinc transport system substrate-binding protein
MAEVAAQAKALKVTTIFFETLVSPKVAETLASEMGAKAEVLDPGRGAGARIQRRLLLRHAGQPHQVEGALGCV